MMVTLFQATAKYFKSIQEIAHKIRPYTYGAVLSK